MIDPGLYKPRFGILGVFDELDVLFHGYTAMRLRVVVPQDVREHMRRIYSSHNWRSPAAEASVKAESFYRRRSGG